MTYQADMQRHKLHSTPCSLSQATISYKTLTYSYNLYAV